MSQSQVTPSPSLPALPGLRRYTLERISELQHKITQRRQASQLLHENHKRQITGAFWRLDRSVLQITGKHTPIRPPFSPDPDDVEFQPTMLMRAVQPVQPRQTDKIPAYHEPCSDSFDITALRLPLSLKSLIETSMQEHGRRPDAIRLNSVALLLLTLTDACQNGRYEGTIPLVADPELDSNELALDYL